MKKHIVITVMAAGICIAGSLNASADLVTTTDFGTIPGAGANPYSGTGIPFNNSVVTTVTGLPDSDTLTMALSATAHGAFNPAPGNNGVDTFTVNTGLVSGRSPWNYDFYFSSANGYLSGYSFLVTILNVGNGESFSYNPLLVGDNVGGPGSAGNSESLDFIAAFIGYNPNLDDTYKVTASASFADGPTIASESETIIAGAGAAAPVPEPTTIISGALLLLPFGAGVARKLRKRHTA